MRRLRLLIAVPLLAVAHSAGVALAEPFEVIESDNGVLITDAGRKVLFFQRQPKSLDGAFRRANYVHPLYGLDGEVLTEDFPADHRHQRGVYWAWHQLLIGTTKLGDAWSTQDFDWDVQSVQGVENNEAAAAIETKVLWKSPALADAFGEPVPVVEERTKIRVQRATESSRAIDFEICLKALLPDVKIGGSEDDKGYGGFSVRIKLPDDLKFRGTAGDIEPQFGAVDAGPWVDLATENRGIAILVHPSNPGYPQPWVLRRKRSMQNPVYPGSTPVTLSQHDPLVLRYRLIVHDGKLDARSLDVLHQAYDNAVH